MLGYIWQLFLRLLSKLRLGKQQLTGLLPHEWPEFIKDLCCGTMLSGRIGAGKTSLLRWLAGKLARFRCGGLWTCVKPDEAQNALSILSKAGQEERVLRFQPESGITYNWLAYEITRHGGSIETVVQIFEMLSDAVQRTSSEKGESFWKLLFSRAMRYAIIIAYYAKGSKATLEDVQQVIVSSPATLDQSSSEAFLLTPCATMLKQAAANMQGKLELRLVKEACDFFMVELPGLGDKARGAAMSQCLGVLAPFLIEPIRSVVCSETSSFTPLDVLDGLIVVLDYPIMTYGNAGKLFQLLLCIQVTQAVLARPIVPGIRPVFLMRDEYQLLCNSHFDVMAQTVARSQGLINILAFQNLPALKTGLGQGENAEHEMNALLGCLVNKYFLAQNCPQTNEYAASLCGRSRKVFMSFNEDDGNGEHGSVGDKVFGKKKTRIGGSQQWHYNVPPHYFQCLRTGGRENDYVIDYYYLHDGMMFNGKPYALCAQDQRRDL